MVCVCCQIVVKDELIKLGLHPIHVGSGVAEIQETLSDQQQQQVRLALQKAGLELLQDKKGILVQKIKNVIVEVIQLSDDPPVYNFSVYLSARLGHDYTYMSNLFSEKLGTTIEKFYIVRKIERVKELLIDHELTLTAIALKMHYSSVAHLSSQFKRVTGFTPSRFKRLQNRELCNILLKSYNI
jgi:AraC-like DNA-binding protein